MNAGGDIQMTNDRDLFYKELNTLVMDPKVRRLCRYPQHNGSNTLIHCVQVAKRSFDLAEQFGWKIDEAERARGAMLHDYYQYSIKEEGLTAYRHGTSHPLTAMKKALEDFDLTDKEKNIIRGHMWPLTFIHPPKSREALLVCLADKDIAAREFVRPELRKAKRVAGTGFTRLRKVSKPEIDKAKELAEPALDKAKETVNRLRKLF